MSDNIFWLLELEVKPGQSDNFRQLMGEMVESVQANEPNTLNYEWTISKDQQSCHIYERYTDSAAVMTHLGNFGANFADRFMACLEATSFHVYGNSSDEVREALSAFGPVFLTPIGGFAR